MSCVGDSPCGFPAFHQIYGLSSADCPQLQTWTRQSFGRQIPTPLPIKSSQKTHCNVRDFKQLQSKGENWKSTPTCTPYQPF